MYLSVRGIGSIIREESAVRSMARELSKNNRACSDGEESPGGLSVQSSSNYLAPSEPPGSEVSALEMSQDEDYQSCDADAGLRKLRLLKNWLRMKTGPSYQGCQRVRKMKTYQDGSQGPTVVLSWINSIL